MLNPSDKEVDTTMTGAAYLISYNRTQDTLPKQGMQHLTPCSSSQAPARRVQAVQFANQM
jgi:hypothetical protein